MKRRAPAKTPRGESECDTAAAPGPADWMFLQPAILDQMHDAVLSTDLAGKITGCNRAAGQLYGLTSKELIGADLEIVFPAEEVERFRVAILPAVREHGDWRGQVQQRTRGGKTIWVHASFSLLRDGEGQPAGVAAFCVDVTAQKLGDLAVKRSDEVERQLAAASENTATMKLLMTAVEKAEDVILITEAEPIDLPGPRILYVNPAFETMTGYTAEEAIGQTPRILQGEKTDRAALDRIRASLKAWHPVRERMTNYRKDGSEFIVELSIVPIADETGWYTHWMAIQRDMTEEDALRRRLEEGEARLHFLTEAMPQLLWTADAQGRCTFVSNACAQHLGAPAEEICGDGWVSFIHPEDLSRATTTWKEAVESKVTFFTEYRLRRHDGQYMWYLHRAAPRLNEHGDVVEWIGSSTDIEQQKRSEEAIRQTEKLAAVGRLASSIAHEINNPVSSVVNLLFLLSADPTLSRSSREYVQSAQEEVARVAEITTQTLRFHKQSTSAAPARVPEILDAVLAFYRPRLATAKIQCRREYRDTEKLRCLAGDLRQAFSNLVGNAIEATPPGGRLRVRIRESLSWRYRQRHGIRVTIADTGVGMDRTQIQRIFEPFFTTKGVTGTGLGLWITKDLIAKHDGIISLRSSKRENDNGTVISVFLPYHPRTEPPPAKRPAQPPRA